MLSVARVLIGVAAMVAVAMAASALPAQSAVPGGAALFQQRCAACHSLKAGSNGAGPSLAGLVGRKAASISGFGYSAALLKAGLVWTPAQLDQFLAAPQKMVPGTRMPIAVADAMQRQALIEYLKMQKL